MSPLARLRPLALVLAAAVGLAACSENTASPVFNGYVEGDYRRVAAEGAGRIVSLEVRRGQRVEAGAVLFRLSSTDEDAQVAEAEARVAQAEAQIENLRSGMRPEEIAVLEAQVAEARAAWDAADKEHARAATLRAQNVVAQAQVEAAEEALAVNAARVDAATRQLAVGRLPARAEEIAAAERNLDAVNAALGLARLQQAKRIVTTPVAGIVDETYFDAGEFVGAAQPVVSILPDDGKTIRFFLPEPLLASAIPGRRILINCDGCAPGLTAELTLVVTQPEFTPPVIYSRENREKLVWRAEARPLGDAARLPVGQPVDLRFEDAP